MATEAEIEQKIKDILATDFECDPERLTPDVNLFTDLDLDSIDAVDLVVRLQQETGKKVDPESFRKIRTLRDVTAAVVRLVNG
ncbi:MAG: acyl carrier protein [Kiritimatiellae bacterium]|nr:acyl carrier protein [Kiritimatiellia bacterium]